jgi:ankyrin repeat and BTB/POZ domain-containing protein 1
VLSVRSPYFHQKLALAPGAVSWKLPSTVPPQAFGIAVNYLYFGEVPRDLGAGPGTGFTESEVFAGIDKISKQLEIQDLFDSIVDGPDRRLARQRRTTEVEKGRGQMESWFYDNVITYRVIVNSERASEIKWTRDNGIFADVLLRADQDTDDEESQSSVPAALDPASLHVPKGIPVGPTSQISRSSSPTRKSPKSVLYPVHKAMLLRSEYFLAMFSSGFREAQETEHLQIITVDCSPEVLEIVLKYLYTEKTEFPLEIALDVLLAADQLFIEKLKTKAAVVISTSGNATMPQIRPQPADWKGKTSLDGQLDEAINIYDITRVAWLTRVQRLEEFAAQYIAYRLEYYIDEGDFADLIRESATRITERQETDSIELLDDIRYYLSERFKMRFEDSGLEDMMDEETQQAELNAAVAASVDEGIDMSSKADVGTALTKPTSENQILKGGTFRTLDGNDADDEFQTEAMNYNILLGKIDTLLERLKLDA